MDVISPSFADYYAFRSLFYDINGFSVTFQLYAHKRYKKKHGYPDACVTCMYF